MQCLELLLHIFVVGTFADCKALLEQNREPERRVDDDGRLCSKTIELNFFFVLRISLPHIFAVHVFEGIRRMVEILAQNILTVRKFGKDKKVVCYRYNFWIHFLYLLDKHRTCTHRLPFFSNLWTYLQTFLAGSQTNLNLSLNKSLKIYKSYY